MPSLYFSAKEIEDKRKEEFKRGITSEKNRKRREETTLHLHKGSRQAHVQQSRLAGTKIRANGDNSHPEPSSNESLPAKAGTTDVDAEIESTPVSGMTDWSKAEKETATLHDNQRFILDAAFGDRTKHTFRGVSKDGKVTLLCHPHLEQREEFENKTLTTVLEFQKTLNRTISVEDVTQIVGNCMTSSSFQYNVFTQIPFIQEDYNLTLSQGRCAALSFYYTHLLQNKKRISEQQKVSLSNGRQRCKFMHYLKLEKKNKSNILISRNLSKNFSVLVTDEMVILISLLFPTRTKAQCIC